MVTLNIAAGKKIRTEKLNGKWGCKMLFVTLTANILFMGSDLYSSRGVTQ